MFHILFSKEVQCTPEKRGQQLFHNKLLRLFGTAEHCCNCNSSYIYFPLSVAIPALQITSSVKLMCRRKDSTQVRPCWTWWSQPQRQDKLLLLGTMNFRKISPFFGGGGSTDRIFSPSISVSNHLGCTRLTSKLDITAATSSTFLYHSGNDCVVTAVIYSQRTTPGATVTSASAAAARSFPLKRLRGQFLYYNPSRQGRCHNHFQTLPVLQVYSFLDSCLYLAELLVLILSRPKVYPRP